MAERQRKKRGDRLHSVAEAELRPDSLVGSFFHSFEPDGAVKWQGCVVAEPHSGVYLVELFDWIVGSSSNQHLVRIEDMLGWQFYDDHEWMNNEWEHSLEPRQRRRERQEE